MMARMEIVCLLVHLHLHVLLQSRQAISLCICYLYANVPSHNTPIANMASLPWDRGYSVVTVAMGRFASVDSLKGSSFEGFQECFSCSLLFVSSVWKFYLQATWKRTPECVTYVYSRSSERVFVMQISLRRSGVVGSTTIILAKRVTDRVGGAQRRVSIRCRAECAKARAGGCESRSGFAFAVSDLLLPWQLWATVWNKSKTKNAKIYMLLLFETCRMWRSSSHLCVSCLASGSQGICS